MNKTKKWLLILVVLIVIATVKAVMEKGQNKTEIETAQVNTDSLNYAKKIFKAKVEAEVNLRNYITKQLDDPKTFDVISQKSWQVGNTLVVAIEFTAKNKLGGSLKKTIQAEADMDGRLTKIFN